MRRLNEIKIGKQLKELRKIKGYTQKQVADTIGVTTRYMSDLEQDRSSASYDILIKMCNLFDTTPDEIFEEYLQVCPKNNVQYSIDGAIEYLKRIKI